MVSMRKGSHVEYPTSWPAPEPEKPDGKTAKAEPASKAALVNVNAVLTAKQKLAKLNWTVGTVASHDGGKDVWKMTEVFEDHFIAKKHVTGVGETTETIRVNFDDITNGKSPWRRLAASKDPIKAFDSLDDCVLGEAPQNHFFTTEKITTRKLIKGFSEIAMVKCVSRPLLHTCVGVELVWI